MNDKELLEKAATWEQVSELSRTWMNLLGNFTPTTRPECRQVKGYIYSDDGDDGRTYFDSGELRELSAACVEVANWLDRRAGLPIPRQPAAAIGETT